MKNILLTFLFLTSFCFSQNYKSIQVDYTVILESISNEKTKSDKNSWLFEEINNTIKEKKFILEINSEELLYREIKTLEDDERKKSFHKIANTIYSIGDYYYNIKRNKLFSIANEVNIVTANDYKWELTNESKKINNYSCYKAICNFEYLTRKGDTAIKVITAWYTPEINFNYGPNGYMGLPGLILELDFNKTKIVAKEIHFFKEDIKLEIPKNKEVTEEDYLKRIKIN